MTAIGRREELAQQLGVEGIKELYARSCVALHAKPQEESLQDFEREGMERLLGSCGIDYRHTAKTKLYINLQGSKLATWISSEDKAAVSTYARLARAYLEQRGFTLMPPLPRRQS
jgi:hypothetical protein